MTVVKVQNVRVIDTIQHSHNNFLNFIFLFLVLYYFLNKSNLGQIDTFE